MRRDSVAGAADEEVILDLIMGGRDSAAKGFAGRDYRLCSSAPSAPPDLHAFSGCRAPAPAMTLLEILAVTKIVIILVAVVRLWGLDAV
jgi:hypothetical protein